MRWTYDPETDVLDIHIARGKVAGSQRLSGAVIVDLAADGRVLALEVLDAGKRLPAISSHTTGRVEVGSESVLSFRLTGSLGEENERLKSYVADTLELVQTIIGLVPVAGPRTEVRGFPNC